MSGITAVVAASSDFTVTDNFDADETVVIGGKTYTMKSSLTNTDGFVQLAPTVDPQADAAATLNALADAINLSTTYSGAGAGTSYAAATTINPLVVATRPSALVLRITAKVPGVIGNQITTTDTHGEGSWTSTVLTGGTGAVNTAIAEILAQAQVNAEVGQLLRAIDGTPGSN